jgi:phenylacetate-CoA ligase
MSYPSVLSAVMAELARGGEPVRLKAVMSLGENPAEGFAEAARDCFGARHIDIYGAQELGVFAHRCADGPQYHVAAETTLVEILDDDGKPARPGEVGRVVATPFYSYAMPMIRYDVGDYAVPGAPCGCGRHLPTIERILGRTRNVFRFADGTARWPRGLNVLARYIDFVQIKIVQRDFGTVEVRYVPADNPGRDDQLGAAQFLRDVLNPDIHVDFVKVAEIPRAASGKFEDFVSLVGGGDPR